AVRMVAIATSVIFIRQKVADDDQQDAACSKARTSSDRAPARGRQSRAAVASCGRVLIRCAAAGSLDDLRRASPTSHPPSWAFWLRETGPARGSLSLLRRSSVMPPAC